MGVHSPQVDALEGAMLIYTTPDTLPFEAGDPEWVAQLFSTVRAGDLDAVLDRLDAVARVMRRAAKARRMLATVDPELIRAGLQVRTARRGAS
jgi:hypothetical protein